MKKNLLFGLLTILVAGFGFGGISMADGINNPGELQTAISNAEANAIITLGGNITITEPIIVTKSITIDGGDYTIGYAEYPNGWSNEGKNYVFKIGSSESDSIEVNLENITIENSFYGILDGFTSSKSTKVNLENVIFSDILFGAIDLQNEKAEIDAKDVTIPDSILSVNIDTYDASKTYNISGDLQKNCYVNGSKYFCSETTETLNSAITASSALSLPSIVAKIDSVYYGDLQNAIEAADENDTVKIIKEYNDVLPNEIKKSINIESEDDISVTFKGKCSYSSFSNCGSNPITSIAENKVVTFSGVTFDLAGNESNFDNAHHNGIQGKGKLIMNNCTINGTLTTYGDSEFNDCKFTKVSDGYNIFGILGGETKFKNCSFSGKDRNINVYNSNVSTSTQHVVFDNCKYNASIAPVKGAIVVHETADNTNTNKFKVEIVNYETSDLGEGYAGIKNVHAIWQEENKNAFVKYLTGNGLIMFDDGRRDIPHEGGEITISINGGDPVYSTPKIESESIPVENNDKGLTITKNYYLSLGKILSEQGEDTSKDGSLNKFYITNPIYSITLGTVTNGTISSNLLSAEEGTTVTLTATPASNYTFGSWTVKDSEGNAITVTNNKFTMPESNVTVTATFNAKSSGGSSGRSSSSSSSSNTTEKKDETKNDTQVIELKGEVTEESTNAEEVNKEESKPEVVISDAAKATYNEEQLAAYQWAYENDITTINDADEARLGDPLTRAELAKMMSQYISSVLKRSPIKTDLPGYKDVDESLGDLADYIVKAYQYQIMGIDADGNALEYFNPNGLVTRAEYATVFSRVLYGSANNQKDGPYYEKHLAALKEAGILSEDDPTIQEVRGWVMLMMYRSANEKAPTPEEPNAEEGTGNVVGIANPASTYCVEQEGEIEIREDAEGAQYGVCKFKDGTEVEEWEYFRANHKDETTTGAVAESSTGDVAETSTGAVAENATGAVATTGATENN